MLRQRFLFLLKFFRASVPSRPQRRCVSFDVLTAPDSILISLVWRMLSITGLAAAFLAGI